MNSVGWTFLRQLGIGEKEHVRTQLLGVVFLGTRQIVGQLRGAMRAADTLGMMLRAHVNMSALSTTHQEQVYSLFRENQTHQLEPHCHLSKNEFTSMFTKAEIIVVQPSADSGVYAADIESGILKVWADSNGRFLNGNFALKTDDELRKLYPQFYHDAERFWENWND